MTVFGGIFFLVLGLALVVVCVVTGEEALASRQWPTTRGEITSFELQQSVGIEGDVNFGIKVRYRFVLDGVEWIGMRAYFGDYFLFLPPPSAGGPRRRMNYRVGEIVDVSYDPSNPNESVLHPGVSNALLYALVGGVALAAIGLIVTIGG